jgi:hypothetical protein
MHPIFGGGYKKAVFLETVIIEASLIEYLAVHGQNESLGFVFDKLGVGP